MKVIFYFEDIYLSTHNVELKYNVLYLSPSLYVIMFKVFIQFYHSCMQSSSSSSCSLSPGGQVHLRQLLARHAAVGHVGHVEDTRLDDGHVVAVVAKHPS